MTKELRIFLIIMTLGVLCCAVAIGHARYEASNLQSLTFTKDGQEYLNGKFKHRIKILQKNCGFEFTITSGYRRESHPIEIIKSTIGYHVRRLAVDIRVKNDRQRMTLVREALKMGFNGIGVDGTFVHIDDRNTIPVLWVY